MKKFKPSKYQQAIYDFIENGEGNLIIDALAGSGKTTTIINALDKISPDESVLFLAFNKSIVEELKIKTGLYENVEVMTLHSLGARSIRDAFRCQINGNKYKIHLNEGLRFGKYKPLLDLDYDEMPRYKQNINKLIDLIRVNLCTTVEEFEELARKHDLDILDNEIEVASNVIRWGFREITEIDFTDMIYFPSTRKSIKLKQYDWVFIDECQDLNEAQRTMFLKCVKDTGRFVAVGDPRQAIYGFAGADVESFNKLTAVENTTILPLSVCYRCDVNIIEKAKEIVPEIEARDGASRGVVTNCSIDDIEDDDMVLCRFTAPLTELCMKFIASGRKAHVKGKDIGSNLVSLINGTKMELMEDALKRLRLDLSKVLDRITEALKCDRIEAMEQSLYIHKSDMIDAIEVLSSGLDTTREVIDRVKAIFSDDAKQGICLSTIHKSKGLEANRVFILKSESLMSLNMDNDWMAQQEVNLAYVAYTRAKHFLGFISSDSI